MPELMAANSGKSVLVAGADSNPEAVEKYVQCYAKCTSQLLLTRLVAEVVSRFFDHLRLEHISILLQSLDS